MLPAQHAKSERKDLNLRPPDISRPLYQLSYVPGGSPPGPSSSGVEVHTEEFSVIVNRPHSPSHECLIPYYYFYSEHDRTFLFFFKKSGISHPASIFRIFNPTFWKHPVQSIGYLNPCQSLQIIEAEHNSQIRLFNRLYVLLCLCR